MHRKTPVPRPEACNFIKKEAPAKVLSYEFCVICKNTFYYGTPVMATSISCIKKYKINILSNAFDQNIQILSLDTTFTRKNL